MAFQRFGAGQKDLPFDAMPSEIHSQLPALLKRLSEEQLLSEQFRMHSHNNGDSEKIIMRPSPSNSVIRSTKSVESDMETEDSGSNVILKIPSFKPTTSKNGTDLFNKVRRKCSLDLRRIDFVSSLFTKI